MPNWCENELAVKGSKEEVEKLVAYLKGRNGAVDFDKVIPYPEKYKQRDKEFPGYFFPKETNKSKRQREKLLKRFEAKWGSTKDGFNSGGYEWCISHWGTKWNACAIAAPEGIQEIDGGKHHEWVVDFDTAWSPPVPVIAKLIEDFPKLSFVLRYWEGSNAFRGRLSGKGGKVRTNSIYEYKGNRGG